MRIILHLLTFCCVSFITIVSHAQNSKLLNTRWTTEEKTVVQISEENHVLVGRQISSKTEKYKPQNGTIVLKNFKHTASNEFTGTLIDPASQKEYSSKFILSSNGKLLYVKIKYGFLTFNREWSASK